jgi:hypothetical protein
MVLWGKLAVGSALLAYTIIQLVRGAAWDHRWNLVKRRTEPGWFWWYVGPQMAAALFVIIGTLLYG